MQFDWFDGKNKERERERDELKYLGNKKSGFHHFFFFSPHPETKQPTSSSPSPLPNKGLQIYQNPLPYNLSHVLPTIQGLSTRSAKVACTLPSSVIIPFHFILWPPKYKSLLLLPQTVIRCDNTVQTLTKSLCPILVSEKNL